MHVLAIVYDIYTPNPILFKSRTMHEQKFRLIAGLGKLAIQNRQPCAVHMC